MLISEYLKLRGDIAVTTGRPLPGASGNKDAAKGPSPFAALLEEARQNNSAGVEFSKHALDRIEQRGIDLSEGDMLGKLDKAVGLAQQKGSSDTLVLIGSTAFVVSVKNNKVITAMTNEDLKDNVFTNIDSTVIV